MIRPALITPSTEIRAWTISSFSTRAPRTSPIPISISQSGKLVAGAAEQHARLGQRQADDVGIAAGDMADVDFAIALEGVAAGLAAPLPVARIIVDFRLAEALHRDHRFNQPHAHAVAGHGQRDAGQYAVPASGQQAHAA